MASNSKFQEKFVRNLIEYDFLKFKSVHYSINFAFRKLNTIKLNIYIFYIWYLEIWKDEGTISNSSNIKR